jgi:hypothetical protein
MPSTGSKSQPNLLLPTEKTSQVYKAPSEATSANSPTLYTRLQ